VRERGKENEEENEEERERESRSFIVQSFNRSIIRPFDHSIERSIIRSFNHSREIECESVRGRETLTLLTVGTFFSQFEHIQLLDASRSSGLQ
jgi:hypothetical protein